MSIQKNLLTIAVDLRRVNKTLLDIARLNAKMARDQLDVARGQLRATQLLSAKLRQPCSPR